MSEDTTALIREEWGAYVDSLAEAIREKLRSVLVVQTKIELVPFGTLERSDYKSRLVEHP